MRRPSQTDGLDSSNGIYGDVHDVDHSSYGYKGYDGPDRGFNGEVIKPDEQLRQEWLNIKVQTFRLNNGVILHAKNEIEAGAYRSKGATLVDTVYRDD
jgi:hypothetical protein